MCTGDFALGLKPAATTMYLVHDGLVTRGACSQSQFDNKKTQCSCLCCLELRAQQGRRGAGNKSKAIMLVRAQMKSGSTIYFQSPSRAEFVGGRAVESDFKKSIKSRMPIIRFYPI